jgi:hypothetical protein
MWNKKGVTVSESHRLPGARKEVPLQRSVQDTCGPKSLARRHVTNSPDTNGIVSSQFV